MQLTHQDVLSILPNRPVDGHKGNFGRILLLCGSCGYTGAAALAAMGALRCGAGLVFLGVPTSIYTIAAVKLTEPIVFPLPEEDGMLSADAVSLVQKKMRDMDAVLIGPGLGQSLGTMAVLNAVLQGFDGPVILDADAINLLSVDLEMLRQRNGVTILTPHEGEFRRLGIGLHEERIAGAMKLAKELHCIVVRKGHNSVITDANVVYINPTGNPGMAVGGSGDVLSGMIAGLLGQGIEPLQAAACAVWLHGAAGDLAAEKLGQYAMLPSDLLAQLPRLLK